MSVLQRSGGGPDQGNGGSDADGAWRGVRCFGWRRLTAGTARRRWYHAGAAGRATGAIRAALRAEVIGIIRERYADFGPTLAAEKLAELHGIHLGRETLRQWMIAAGLWKDRRAAVKARPPAALPPRLRRRADPDRRLRALVVRGPRAAMHAARLHRRRHQPADASAVRRERESTFAYFQATRAYLERTASRSRSTPTSTPCSGSTRRRRPAAMA